MIKPGTKCGCRESDCTANFFHGRNVTPGQCPADAVRTVTVKLYFGGGNRHTRDGDYPVGMCEPCARFHEAKTGAQMVKPGTQCGCTDRAHLHQCERNAVRMVTVREPGKTDLFGIAKDFWGVQVPMCEHCALNAESKAVPQVTIQPIFSISFDVDFPGERAAGLRPYSDTIVIQVDSGDPGGVPGEFEEHMRSALAEWFDGAKVVAK